MIRDKPVFVVSDWGIVRKVIERYLLVWMLTQRLLLNLLDIFVMETE
jgi:hypothetical protein